MKLAVEKFLSSIPYNSNADLMVGTGRESGAFETFLLRKTGNSKGIFEESLRKQMENRAAVEIQ
jgi:hypothetical protein